MTVDHEIPFHNVILQNLSDTVGLCDSHVAVGSLLAVSPAGNAGQKPRTDCQMNTSKIIKLSLIVRGFTHYGQIRETNK